MDRMQTKDREDVALKTFKAEVKADAPAPGATTGSFDARVAAFGNVDLQGDRIEPEAFDGTLAAWSESGDSVPVIWSHQWDDPMAHVGWVESAAAEDGGLRVKGVIDLSTDLARQVHRLMVDRRVKEFSFAYLPTDAAPDPEDANVRVLKALDLIEVGPTLKGANPATELYDAKSRERGRKHDDEDPPVTAEDDEAFEQVVADGEPKAMVRVCPNCEAENPADATECSECGEDLTDVEPVDNEAPVGGSADEPKSGEPEAKYGRVLSKANETKLRAARDALDEVLASLADTGSADDEASDDGKSSSADRSGLRSIDRTDAALRVLELGG